MDIKNMITGDCDCRRENGERGIPTTEAFRSDEGAEGNGICRVEIRKSGGREIFRTGEGSDMLQPRRISEWLPMS
jgi:hypothetical protein